MASRTWDIGAARFVGGSAKATDVLPAVQAHAANHSSNFSINTPVSEADVTSWKQNLQDALQQEQRFHNADDFQTLSSGRKFMHMDPLKPLVPAAIKTLSKLNSMKAKKAFLKERQQLQIYKQRASIVSNVKSKPITTVVSGHGSGKTTQTPLILWETELFKNSRIVLVVQSDFVAVSTAARLRQLTGESEATIAHCTATDHAVGEGTTLVVTTPAVFLRSLICNEQLDSIGCVIVDEAASSTVDSMLLLSALRDQITGPAPKFKLVVLLPTFAAEKTLFKNFCKSESSAQSSAIGQLFGRLNCDVDDQGVQRAVATTPYMSLDDTCQWVESSLAIVSDVGDLPTDNVAALKVTSDLTASDFSLSNGSFSQNWVPFITRIVERVAQIGGSGANTCLVILPTFSHVITFANAVENKLRDIVDVVVAAEAIAASSAAAVAVNEALRASTAKRKLVVIDNCIADSFVTIDDVDVVIDSCRESVVVYDTAAHSDSTSLEISPVSISKSRRSLATSSQAMVMHLAPQAALQARPQEPSHPLSRASLDDLVSFVSVTKELHGGNFSSTGRLLKLMMSWTCIAETEATLTVEKLQRLCAPAERRLRLLGHSSPGDSSDALSSLGTTVMLLGLPPTVGRLLTFSAALNVLPEALTVAATWLVGDPFALHELLADSNVRTVKGYFSQASCSDLYALVKVIDMWRQNKSNERDIFDSTQMKESAANVFLDVRDQLARIVASCGWVLSSSVTGEQLDGALIAGTAQPTATRNGISPGLDAAVTGALAGNIGFAINGESTVALPRVNDSTAPVPLSRFRGVTSFLGVAGTQVGAPRRNDAPVLFLNSARATFTPQQQQSEPVVINHEVVANPSATVVFCGEGERPNDQEKPNRCRGFFSPMTDAWRSTKIARKLPPVSSIAPKAIDAPRMARDVAEKETLVVDSTVSYTLLTTTTNLLLELRSFMVRRVDKMLTEMCHCDPTDQCGAAFTFLERRTTERSKYLRERRSLQRETPAAFLSCNFNFTYELGEPSASGSSGVVAHHGKAAGGRSAGDAQQLFTGLVPNNDIQSYIKRAAMAVKSSGTRETEMDLMRQSQLFGFLNPTNEYYPYYTHILRQVAPELSWLGDDLDQLEEFLQQLEVEVRDEIGFAAEAQEQAQMLEQQQPQEMATAFDGGEVHGTFAIPQVAVAAEVPAEPEFNPMQAAAELTAAMARGGPQPVNDADELVINIGGKSIPKIVPDSNVSLEAPDEMPTAHQFEADDGAMALPQVIQPPEGEAAATQPNEAMIAQLQALVGGGGLVPGQFPPPPAQINPLSMPPPMLDPSLKQRPSVIIYPLPRSGVEKKLNLPLILAKALGETMNIKVGPTLLVGGRARIDVPNSRVEQRALELKKFVCLGETVFIAPNESIFDNPNRMNKRDRHFREAIQSDQPRHMRRVEYSPERNLGGGDRADTFPVPRMAPLGGNAAGDAPPARPHNMAKASANEGWDLASDVSDSSDGSLFTESDASSGSDSD